MTSKKTTTARARMMKVHHVVVVVVTLAAILPITMMINSVDGLQQVQSDKATARTRMTTTGTGTKALLGHRLKHQDHHHPTGTASSSSLLFTKPWKSPTTKKRSDHRRNSLLRMDIESPSTDMVRPMQVPLTQSTKLWVPPRHLNHATRDAGTATASPPIDSKRIGIDIDSTQGNDKASPYDESGVNDESVHRVATSHGMPWATSIDPTYRQGRGQQQPYYMPFWEHQLSIMKARLHNLRAIPVVSRKGQDMSYVEDTNNKDDGSAKATMRMHTMMFTCDEYELIRMTLMDGGKRTQVYTSVWYPQPQLYKTEEDDGDKHPDSVVLPILACDLLKFGSRTLCISDFQPIHEDRNNNDDDVDANDDNDETTSSTKASLSYEDAMRQIRDQHPSLHGERSTKYYNGDDFFSEQMLLGRHDAHVVQKQSQKRNRSNKEPSTTTATTIRPTTTANDAADDMVFGSFFPAYDAYVNTHIDMVQRQHQQQQQANRRHIENSNDVTKGNEQQEQPQQDSMMYVRRRYAAYDKYSVQHDPSLHMLSRAFGNEWAHDYVHDILFPSSKES